MAQRQQLTKKNVPDSREPAGLPAMIVGYLRDLIVACREGWDRFWFTPSDPATLGMIRICAGAMLFYTHLVWTRDWHAFFGPNGWISAEAVAKLQSQGTFWSVYRYIPADYVTTFNILGLAVFACLALGLHTRIASVLSFIITLSVIHRAPGSMFGLDQINALLATYLMLGPSGAAWSVDRYLARKKDPKNVPAVAAPSVGTNISIRLIQLHMAIIYFYAGMAKLQGGVWWDGTAFWGAVSNLEYQTIDLTWLADWPRLINVITHLTLFWELLYIGLVWPRLTRPIIIFLAIPVHVGIAFCLGMITFGTAMLIGNLAFVSPALIRAIMEKLPLGKRGAADEAVMTFLTKDKDLEQPQPRANNFQPPKKGGPSMPTLKTAPSIPLAPLSAKSAREG